MAEQGVRFVRIKGRVVPLRDRSGTAAEKHNREEKLKAAGLIASGVVVGGAAGFGSSLAHHEAAHHSNVAMNYKAAWKFNKAKAAESILRNSKLRRAAGAFKNLAAKSTIEARRFWVGGKRIQNVGLVGGSSLIAAGVHKALPKEMKEENKAAVATGAGLGSAFAIRTTYYKHLGKMKTWDAVKLAAKRVVARGIKT